MPESWEDVAKAKRDSISALIPEEWRIKDPSSRDDQVDVTGKYIQSFLSSTEVEITETDAADIARNVAARTWKAVDVIKAFSHRAALAHQLVSHSYASRPNIITESTVDQLPAGNLLR